jgi:uncharacterized metal-binding protein YceD (DUF177 family)
LGKFDAYRVTLKNMAVGDTQKIKYRLDNQFFADIDGPEVNKGKVDATLVVQRKLMNFELNFILTGSISLECDRCLDEMELPVNNSNKLIVKIGKTFTEENDEVLVLPENDQTLNVAWFLYEFVALAIPIKHVHPPGKCNKNMTAKLKKHSPKINLTGADDDDNLDDNELDIDDDQLISLDDPHVKHSLDTWDDDKDLII